MAPAIWHRALRISLVVGTVLTVINQGDVILRGDADVGVWVKIALTYTVPFCVSVYAAMAALKGDKSERVT